MEEEVEMVTITREEYERLLGDSLFLDKLFAYGVDSWEGYSLALEDDDD